MGLFDFLKGNKKATTAPSAPQRMALSPTYLENFTESVSKDSRQSSKEWHGRLKTPEGHTKFKIKYYGQLHSKYPNLIVGTDFAPAMVIAEDEQSGQQILLFDGCRHGYNALFCDEFTDEQVHNRAVTTQYHDAQGCDVFEVLITTYNNFDYDSEFADEVDQEGRIEILNGSQMDFEAVKRDGFDAIGIALTKTTARRPNASRKNWLEMLGFHFQQPPSPYVFPIANF